MTMREIHTALKYINKRAEMEADYEQKKLTLEGQFHGCKVEFQSSSTSMKAVTLTPEQEAAAAQAIERVKAKKLREAQLNGR